MRSIEYNKTLCLKYYADTKDAYLSDLLIQASIKIENQLMEFYDSICKDFTEHRRSTGAYMIFYQVGPIDHFTHVPGPVAQSS